MSGSGENRGTQNKIKIIRRGRITSCSVTTAKENERSALYGDDEHLLDTTAAVYLCLALAGPCHANSPWLCVGFGGRVDDFSLPNLSSYWKKNESTTSTVGRLWVMNRN